MMRVRDRDWHDDVKHASSKRNRIYYVAAAIIILPVFLFVILGLPFLIADSDLLFDTENTLWLNDGWQLGSEEFVELPAKLDVPKDQPVSVYITLPADFRSDQTICLRSSLQAISVRLAGELIYHFDATEGYGGNSAWIKNMNLPPASAWHIIRLPAESDGVQLEIELQSPYSAMSGRVNSVFYGSKGAVLFYLYTYYGVGVLTSFIVLLTGVVMMFTAVLLRDARDNSLWYLGFFAVFTSIWLFTESRMIQFFTGNSLFIGSAAYLALIVIPIPLLLYVQNAIVRRWRKAYSVACLWFVGLFVINVVFQFSGIMDFFELVVLTHLSMFISVVLIVVSLFREYRVYGNSEVLVFLKALVLLLAFFVIEVVNFYFGNYINTSVYVRVGLILFIIYLGVHSLKRIRKLVDNSRRSELLEKLAYHDILTGAMNRTAYDRDLMKINFNHEVALIAIMDVNYLKQINDEFGHAAGDEAIKLTYDCLEQAFAGVGSCYRIGGDEFAAIFTDNNIELFPKHLNDFEACIDACAQTTEYAYNVAVGYACNKTDEFIDLKSFLALADARMYEHKKKQKNSA